MDEKNVHSGHRGRMRKRFLDTGTNGFEDHELIELLLFYAIKRSNTNVCAHNLIREFKDIAGVMNASEDALKAVSGINSASACLIRFISDLCHCYAFYEKPVNEYFSSAEIEKYISEYFEGICSESCIIISLGQKFNLLNQVILPAGYINQDILSQRSLAETAIRHNLRKIVIGQNHYGKIPIPSERDYAFLKTVYETFRPLGIEIYDYIICGCGRTFSMRKNGAFSLD